MTGNPDKRFRSHMSDLKMNKHPVEDMQEDFNKYGNTFTFTVIDEIACYKEKVKEYEWMRKYDSCKRGIGYNYKEKEKAITGKKGG